MSAASVNSSTSALLATLPAVTQAERDDLAERQGVGQPLATLIETAPIGRIGALAEQFAADNVVRRRLARRLGALGYPSAAAVADAISEDERDTQLAALS